MSGNPRIAFRLKPGDAQAFHRLAADAGGYPSFVRGLLDAEAKTRPLRASMAFLDWLRRLGEGGGGENREAELAQARLEGYREGIREAQTAIEVERHRIQQERAALKQEKARTIAYVNREIKRRNRERAAWAARIRQEGRLDLVGALRVYDTTGRLIDPLLAAITHQALELLDDALKKKNKGNPAFLLQAAARFVRQVASRTGDPEVNNVLYRAATGERIVYRLVRLVPRHPQGYTYRRLRLHELADLLDGLGQSVGRRRGGTIAPLATVSPPEEKKLTLPPAE